MDGGKKLKALREQLGLTVRSVETFSSRIADKHGNPAYAIPKSRLSDIENRGVVPTIYRIYSLAAIYHCDSREVLGWYGVDLAKIAADAGLTDVPKSHPVKSLDAATISTPAALLAPDFDPHRTTNLGTVMEQHRWFHSLQLLAPFAKQRYSYGFVGTEDYTMSPVLAPGSFILVDESQCKVVNKQWRSEHERPIYFVETREGFRCCWCSLEGENLILQPHPLSPEPVRLFRHPQDAEVIGTVVGVAMQLGAGRQRGSKGEKADVPKS